VRVQFAASGVCHSDLTVARGRLPSPLPMVLGHEGAGTVLEGGAAVQEVAPGDRVIASFVPTCGACWFCTNGEGHLCTSSAAARQAVRGTRGDGSTVTAMSGLGTFADVMTTGAASVVKVETDLPSEQLALIGCAVTTGVGAVLNTAEVRAGDIVAVIGAGGVGQAVVQGARIAGASRILVVDPVALKREAARQAGATDLLDPAEDDPVAQLLDATDGRGVDHAFEVVGHPDTILQAFGAARRGGTVVVVGMAGGGATVSFPAARLFSDAKRLLGCFYGSARIRRDFPRMIGLIEAGRLDVGSMVSRRLRLDEVDEGFRAMEAGEVIRSVIV
jgi:S-(hydroxymethyl)glutathione dehydrogenase/alcohol dehydrogenase